MKALKMFGWLWLLTGVIYPLLITGLSLIAMNGMASGSLVTIKGKVAGSSLIGQKFQADNTFWGRPSAVDNNPLPSGGSNLGPTSAALKKSVAERKAALVKANGNAAEIPSELLYASGSGLDPHLSPKAVLYQLERVAKARKVAPEKIKELIAANTHYPFLGFMGEPVVNVLELNIALENL
jgi:K+-transporting ATPase ATPase C chain